MEMKAVPMKNIRHATTASTSETICQSQITSSSSTDALADIADWWWLDDFSVASDLLQSISIEFSGWQTVSKCLWHGRITSWCLLHFMHGMHWSIVMFQYSWWLHVDDAKLSGINVANNTSSNDAMNKFELRNELCRLRVAFKRFLGCSWWRCFKWFDWCWSFDSSVEFCNEKFETN